MIFIIKVLIYYYNDSLDFIFNNFIFIYSFSSFICIQIFLIIFVFFYIELCLSDVSESIR